MTNSDIPNIGKPAKRAISLAGIETLKDFTKWTEKELLELHGVGPKVIKVLKENGVKFKIENK